jgi:Aldehyde:ferredoxin oxidoreductase
MTYADKPWVKSYFVGPFKLEKTMEPYPKIPIYKFLENSAANLEPLLNAYYEFRGWDKNGKPTPEKLKELGLDWLIKEIH